MKLARVVGKLSLVSPHETIAGRRWVVAQPIRLAGLTKAAQGLAGLREAAKGNESANSDEEELIVVDELGATVGSLIAYTDGREAAAPFEPERKPIDAYAACLIDSLSIDSAEVESLLAAKSSS